MVDISNNYRREDKREAYEAALLVLDEVPAACLENEEMLARLLWVYPKFTDMDWFDIRDVARKAWRVHRSRQVTMGRVGC